MWRDWQTGPGKTTGRRKRLPVRIPIRISGVGPDDTYFGEKSETVDVSFDGCCFMAHKALPQGIIVAIRVMGDAKGTEENGKRGLFRLVWQKKVAGGFTTGARELLPHNLWDIDRLSDLHANRAAG